MNKNSGAVIFAAGKSLEGAIPLSLEGHGIQIVLYVVITPTVSALPKSLIRYFEGDNATEADAPVLELGLAQTNDFMLSVDGITTTIPFVKAARYFYRPLFLVASASINNRRVEIELCLNNEVTSSAQGDSEISGRVGFAKWGGQGLEFALQRKVILAGRMTTEEQALAFEEFQRAIG